MIKINPHIKHKFISAFLILGILFSFQIVSFAQDPISDEETFDARYARNIKKSRINGVYIPADIEDAMVELQALSSKEALAKFRSGEEEMVAKKLHFGIGRWMIYNWNFYEGSRFSHYLKNLGIAHPDDQAKFVIIILHRRLNEKNLDMENLTLKLQEERKKMYEKVNEKLEIKEKKGED